MQGDVYPVESADGVSVNQVLDAHWGVLNEDDVRSYSCLSFSHYFVFMIILMLFFFSLN